MGEKLHPEWLMKVIGQKDETKEITPRDGEMEQEKGTDQTLAHKENKTDPESLEPLQISLVEGEHKNSINNNSKQVTEMNLNAGNRSQKEKQVGPKQLVNVNPTGEYSGTVKEAEVEPPYHQYYHRQKIKHRDHQNTEHRHRITHRNHRTEHANKELESNPG